MIGRAASIVQPVRRITILEDAPDNRILKCAVTGEVDLLVTGDDDLLKLKEFEGIPIVRLANSSDQFRLTMLLNNVRS